jgi:hypothetical protein
MKNTKQTIYIYRGSLTGGGSSKIIKDLILFLHNKQKYNIVLISFVSTDLDIDTDENGNLITVKHINIPLRMYWRKKAVEQLAKHIDSQIDPVLISFLDFNSNRFISISNYILRDNIFWMNLDTNHPTKIIDTFQTKNEAVGISYEDLCGAVDVIRLENKNFTKYINKNFQNKIQSFWNTIKIPKCNNLEFKKKFNIINVNGLRDVRKSILPLVKQLPSIIHEFSDFTLHIVGEISPILQKELDCLLNKHSEIKNYLNVQPIIENIHDYYTSCDFMVSTAEFEGASNAVLEAISHELPVLCLKTSLGINEIIEHEYTGFHCEDVDGMCRNIKRICLNNKILGELKNNFKTLKKEITNPNLGINKYEEIISTRKIQHNKNSRDKLRNFSKNLFLNPEIYRQKLDALIIYVDLDNINQVSLENSLKTKAYDECKECLFLIRYRLDSQIQEFENTYLKNDKNKILYKFIETPVSVAKYMDLKTSAVGLLLLSEQNSVKRYCKLNTIDNVVYYDSTENGTWWLQKYQEFLRNLNSWQSKDDWLWMVGTTDVLKNNCCFSLNVFMNFNFESFIKNNQNLGYIQNKKIVNNINFPKEIMKKIRRLY